DRHDLAMISIEQIADRRRVTEDRPHHGDIGPDATTAPADTTSPSESSGPLPQESPLEITEAVDLPTVHGSFRALAVRERPGPLLPSAGQMMPADGAEHLVLTRGDLSTGAPVLTRVPSECVTGDVLGSRRCDCRPQPPAALAPIQHGRRVALTPPPRPARTADRGTGGTGDGIRTTSGRLGELHDAAARPPPPDHPHDRRDSMSGHGSPEQQIPHRPDTRIAIVAGSWHQQVM